MRKPLAAAHMILTLLGGLAALATPAWAGPLDNTVRGVLDDTLGTVKGVGNGAGTASTTAPQSPVDQVLDRHPVTATTASSGASPAHSASPPPPCDPADYASPCRTPDTSLNAVLPGRLVQRVYFLHGSATLEESDRAALADLARLYSRRIGDLVLVGATERTPGSLSDTDQLGLERALAVRSVLQANGIVPDRLRVAEAAPSEGISGDYVDIRLDGY